MNFKSSKFALLFGVINGVLFYLVYQPVKVVYVQYLWHIKNDDYVYISLPEIYRIARETGEFFVWTLLFALASYTAHRLWATKSKSIVTLWLRVATVALAVPILGLWVVHLLLFLLAVTLKLMSACDAPMCDSPLSEMIWLFTREAIDVKFEALLFAVALALNFSYGATIAKLSKHFAK